MKANTVRSLCDIPKTLFNEFINPRTSLSEESTKDSCGNPHNTRVCLADMTKENGALTLINTSSDEGKGRHYRESFMVFNYPARIEVFRPGYEGWSSPVDWKLHILFTTGDPPYTGNTRMSQVWEKGKGYWVEHFLNVQYASGSGGLTSIISKHDDWEFDFLLKVQRRALELAQNVASRGHWQVEWYPEGDYSREPNISGF